MHRGPTFTWGRFRSGLCRHLLFIRGACRVTFTAPRKMLTLNKLNMEKQFICGRNSKRIAGAELPTLTPHIQFLTPKKKSDFGPRRVRSFSNSPTVDGAKERICKESQAPPIHPLLKLCVVHMGCTDGFGVESICCARRELIAPGNTLKNDKWF